MNEFTGKLIEKGQVNQVTEKFKKREFVLEKTEIVGQKEYTDYVKFQLTQDKVDLVENLTIGDEIKVNYNVRGHKWEKDGKVNYFTNLEAWKIEIITNYENISNNDLPNNESDDLPF